MSFVIYKRKSDKYIWNLEVCPSRTPPAFSGSFLIWIFCVEFGFMRGGLRDNSDHLLGKFLRPLTKAFFVPFPPSFGVGHTAKGTKDEVKHKAYPNCAPKFLVFYNSTFKQKSRAKSVFWLVKDGIAMFLFEKSGKRS